MSSPTSARPGSATPDAPGGDPAADPERDSDGVTVTALADVLARAVRALGTAGRPVQASRLAARAWWLLRDGWPSEAEHINGTLHSLARPPTEPEHTDQPGAAGSTRHGTGRKDSP